MTSVESNLRPSIFDLDLPSLADWFTSHGHRAFRAEQVFRWLYSGQVDSFDRMTNLNKSIRRQLDETFRLGRLALVDTAQSQDGSRKLLYRLDDGHHIESVLIPESGHHTLCISSQVGCAQGCRFCMTARIGFRRQLTAGEIIAQVRDAVQMTVGLPDRLTNVVFMGMGEPLENYANVVQALSVIADARNGLGISSRRITLSTAGVVPRLTALGRDTAVSVAISLNATDDKTRSWLMPINRRYPLDALLAACRDFPLPPRRRITFEYILMAGINDTPEDAHRLVRLLKPIKSKINLIPFNEFPGSAFQSPTERVVKRFQSILQAHHQTVIVRYSKGQDIAAACGQLSAQAHEAPPGGVIKGLK